MSHYQRAAANAAITLAVQSSELFLAYVPSTAVEPPSHARRQATRGSHAWRVSLLAGKWGSDRPCCLSVVKKRPLEELRRRNRVGFSNNDPIEFNSAPAKSDVWPRSSLRLAS